METYYTAHNQTWFEPIVINNTVRINNGNGRLYFSKESDPAKVTPESLLTPKLLGGSFEYDIDLS